MRRIVSAFSAAALAFGLVAQALPANAAVAGYDSAYVGQSDWLVLSQGGADKWSVFFQNTGTTTWTRNTSTQVDLAACLSDKVTCNQQDASEAPFNDGWLSATRYATHTQTSVAPGALGTFTVGVKVPATQAAGTYTFNAALVKADTAADIHNEGAFFDVLVQTAAGAGGMTLEPATDTNQTSTTHTVTITLKDSAGAAVANAPIDIFVVNNATWTGACSSSQIDSTASPGSTGTACTIDSGDFVTNSSGQVTFDFLNTTAKTNKIVAWTGSVGATYSSTATQGTALKTWINAVAQVRAAPGRDLNPFGSTHTVTATIRDSAGDPVALAGENIRFLLYRSSVTSTDTNPWGGGTFTSSSSTTGTTATANTCEAPTTGTVTVLQTSVAQTDSTGTATFSYAGPADPTSTSGDRRYECVFVFHDRNNNGVRDAADEATNSQKKWTDETAAATTLSQSPTNDGNPQSTTHVVTATLTDQFGNAISGKTIRFTVSRIGATATASNFGTVITADRTTDSAGKASLGYVGPTFSSNDTINACVFESSACTSVVATAVTKHFATEAATDGTGDAAGWTVRFCDTANDTVYAQNGGNTMFRYIYESTDQYVINAAPSTFAQFETACSAGDDTITIDYNSGVSVFTLTSP